MGNKQARLHSQAIAALVVIVAAAALTLALVGTLERTRNEAASVDAAAIGRGVEVTDGWMHNEVLNPAALSAADQVDGWMFNEVLNPALRRDADVTDGWMHNEILNPPRSAGIDVTDGWMHNEVLNPPADVD